MPVTSQSAPCEKAAQSVGCFGGAGVGGGAGGPRRMIGWRRCRRIAETKHGVGCECERGPENSFAPPYTAPLIDHAVSNWKLEELADVVVDRSCGAEATSWEDVKDWGWTASSAALKNTSPCLVSHARVLYRTKRKIRERVKSWRPEWRAGMHGPQWMAPLMVFLLYITSTITLEYHNYFISDLLSL